MIVPADDFALFDTDNGGGLLLTGLLRESVFDGSIDITAFFGELELAAEHGNWIALAADYALGSILDPAAVCLRGDQPPLRAWIYSRGTMLDRSTLSAFVNARLEKLNVTEKTAGIAEIVPALSLSEYTRSVELIRQWITDGDCYQINFTFPLNFRVFGHPLALYARLRERQPVRYGAFLSAPGKTLLSFSPELFFEREGDRVLTRPMKGTAARGATPEADHAMRDALLSSEKERAENVMIVDLLRNDLGRLAVPGKVRVETLCAAEAYPGLWQMVSDISAELPDVSLLDIFRALFPCGSITGAPKIQAMRRIAQLETRPRGLYTGALGWIAPGGDCRFNVAIRTLEIGDDQHGKLGIGSGIVIDGNPAQEYGECLLKAKFLTGLDPGFALIETLRLENCRYPLLELHLARLFRSARRLGFICNEDKVLALLDAEKQCRPDGQHRVRLTLTHSGNLTLDAEPLLVNENPTRTVRIADELLDPDDYLLRHKTTARSRYDRTLAGLAGSPRIFDAIFLNTRGEVCEGARSNLFIERKGMLLTPPAHCGLLPGVMRQHLLDSGKAVECVLHKADLLDAPALFVANALRGLIPVTLVSRTDRSPRGIDRHQRTPCGQTGG